MPKYVTEDRVVSSSLTVTAEITLSVSACLHWFVIFYSPFVVAFFGLFNCGTDCFLSGAFPSPLLNLRVYIKHMYMPPPFQDLFELNIRILSNVIAAGVHNQMDAN